MLYEKIVEGVFLSRPNRFVAVVKLGDGEVLAHVKNTGRCRELLVEGATVFLEDHTAREDRKLKYSLVAVLKGDLFINMDSQAPNKVAYKSIIDGFLSFEGLKKIVEVKTEKTFENSRFDLYLKDEDGKEGFVEVKGVTLEKNGVASFPDAPTERGVKHLRELIDAKRKGYYAAVLFVIQMDGVRYFTPNDETHKSFGDALRLAKENGVEILAYSSKVEKTGFVLKEKTPVVL